MSYVKTDPQPANLQSGETAVTLDDGTIVAVSAINVPQSNGAPSAICARGRVIKSDGTAVDDPQGQPVESAFAYTTTAEAANDPAQFTAAQKDCLMVVLGEPTTTILTDPMHASALANASIRNRLAALAIAGPVDAGALL